MRHTQRNHTRPDRPRDSKILIRIPAEDHETLREAAAALDVTMSEIIRTAIGPTINHFRFRILTPDGDHAE